MSRSREPYSEHSLSRAWDEIENDCLSMVMYFYRHSGPMSYQTYDECSQETGIPITTIRYYVHHYKIDKDKWFLAMVGEKYGYIVRYCNDPRIKVYVEKKPWIGDGPKNDILPASKYSI